MRERDERMLAFSRFRLGQILFASLLLMATSLGANPGVASAADNPGIAVQAPGRVESGSSFSVLVQLPADLLGSASVQLLVDGVPLAAVAPDQSGAAAFPAVPAGRQGIRTLVASAETGNGPATSAPVDVEVFGFTRTVTLTGPATTRVGSPVTVSSAARDALGDPVAGETLTLRGATTGTAPTAVTDAKGAATFTFTPRATGTLRLVAAAASGAESTPLSITVSPIPGPSAPQSVTTAPGDRALAITWKAPTSTGGTPLVSYKVLVRDRTSGATKGSCTVPATAALRCTVRSLVNGTRYRVDASASNSAGGVGAVRTVTSEIVGTPTAPARVTSFYIAKGLDVVWAKPVSVGGSPLTTYSATIYLNVSSSPVITSCTAKAQTLRCSATRAIKPGTTYIVKVRAGNRFGLGPATPIFRVTARTPAATISTLASADWTRMVNRGVWRNGCPVGRSGLRRLEVTHLGFDGLPRRGALIVNRDVAASLARILNRLYDERFPIRKMVPIEAYWGDDNASMADDNSSAFNCRRPGQANSAAWASPHANGRAVDLNPYENPWIDYRCGCWMPSSTYGRKRSGLGVITSTGPVVRAFRAEGWIWQNIATADYQHFDTGYPSRPRLLTWASAQGPLAFVMPNRGNP